jgi:hypothetical protein
MVKESDLYLEAGRDINNFNKSKILIKEQAKDWTDLIISYNPQSSVFIKGVFGLSCSNKNYLKLLYSILISDLYKYFIFLISGGWGIATHPQTKWVEEYLSFPFIEPDNDTKEKLIILVDQFLLPFEKYYKKFNLGEPIKDEKVLSQINDVINDLYGIKNHEKDLIDYVLNISRYQFQESKQNLFTKKVDSDISFLKKYADVYIKEFEKIYDNEFMRVEIYSLKYFIAMNFKLLKTKPEQKIFCSNKIEVKDVLRELANKLSISQITDSLDPENNLYIQKDIKGFEKDSFYIIKPNEYKCWHRAVAWYDVAEFKDKIEKAEIERFNKVDK